MSGYRPTYADFLDLRNKFLDLCGDYTLLEMMHGIKSHRDLSVMEVNPSFLAARKKDGQESFDVLISLVAYMDRVAQMGTPAIDDAWPCLVDILEGFSGVHESFKPLWAMATAWGVDVGQIEEVVRQGRVGRPTRSSPIASDRLELWQVGNEVLAYFGGEDPGRHDFSREYLKRRGGPVRYGEHSNPGSSVVRRANKVLKSSDGYEGLIRFLRGPRPEQK
jgi:hypothetical protein